MENNKFIFIRDLSIKNKNKNENEFKENLIDEINLDIFSGKLIVIISENDLESDTFVNSFSGKTKIDSGIVFYENDMVLGRAPNLLKNNLQIKKEFSDIFKRFKIMRLQFDLLIETSKTNFFLYTKNFKYVPYKGLIGPIKNKDHIISEIDEEKLKDIFLLARYGWRYVLERKKFHLETILYLKRIMKNYMRQERFVKMLFSNSFIYSDNSYLFLLNKYKIAKEKIQLLKNFLLKNYFLNENLKKTRIEISKYNNLSEFYEAIFLILNEMNQNYKLLDGFFEEAFEAIEQLTALTSRGKIKENYIEHYNKFVFLKLSLVKNKIKKLMTNPDNQNEFDSIMMIKNHIDTLWDKKTFNLKALNSFFNSIYKDINADQFNIDYLQKKVSKFHNSDLENKVKLFFNQNLLKNNFDKNIFNELFLEYDNALKIVKKNIVSDQNIVNAWRKINKIEPKISFEKEQEYIELLKFLGNSSLNENIEKSQYNNILSKYKSREIRKNIQVIFKNPIKTMNSKWTIEEIIGEGLSNFPEIYLSVKNRREYDQWYKSNIEKIFFEDSNIKNVVTNAELKKFLIRKTLDEVGLHHDSLSKYPQELLENEIQKVAIARAIILEPKFIIAQNPIIYLDVTVKNQIISLLKKLTTERGISVLVVGQDLLLWKQYSDIIGLMTNGSIVEIGPPDLIMNNPFHDFTKIMINSLTSVQLKNYYKNSINLADKSLEKYILDEPTLREVEEGHFALLNDDI